MISLVSLPSWKKNLKKEEKFSDWYALAQFESKYHENINVSCVIVVGDICHVMFMSE